MWLTVRNESSSNEGVAMKKIYNAPVVKAVTINARGWLMSHSLEIDGTNAVTQDAQVLSREGSVWDDDGDN